MLIYEKQLKTGYPSLWERKEANDASLGEYFQPEAEAEIVNGLIWQPLIAIVSRLNIADT